MILLLLIMQLLELNESDFNTCKVVSATSFEDLLFLALIS